MTDFYFGGLEMQANTERELALMVLREGLAQNLKITTVDLLGETTVGSRRFIRFRVNQPQLASILKKIPRGSIYSECGQYLVSLNGKVGRIDSAKVTLASLGYPKRFDLQG